MPHNRRRINIHHLPEDLFSNEKILNGFLDSAPRGFGEIASVITMTNEVDISDADRDLVMSGNAKRMFNLPI